MRLMNTITLYNIRKKEGGEYNVSHAYRIFTEDNVEIPEETYSLQGVHVNPKYMMWFENVIFPVILRHNGEEMIHKWAVPACEDPDHLTIAICVNGYLIAPDMLCNTTAYMDGPQKHLDILYAIFKAIKEKEVRQVIMPPQDRAWLIKEDIKHVARMMKRPMF